MNSDRQRDGTAGVNGGFNQLNRLREARCIKEKRQQGRERDLRNRCFPRTHEDTMTSCALLIGMPRFAGGPITLGAIVVRVSVMVLALLCRASHLVNAIRSLGRMRVVRTAPQRKVQQKCCGGDKG